MHELSLVQSVFAIIDKYAQQHGFARVVAVRLSCGRLSGVDPSCLRFAFDAHAQGTPAEGAALEIDILPAVIHCFSCSENTSVDVYTACCPRCGGAEVILVAGTEELKFIDMEVA